MNLTGMTYRISLCIRFSHYVPEDGGARRARRCVAEVRWSGPGSCILGFSFSSTTLSHLMYRDQIEPRHDIYLNVVLMHAVSSSTWDFPKSRRASACITDVLARKVLMMVQDNVVLE